MARTKADVLTEVTRKIKEVGLSSSQYNAMCNLSSCTSIMDLIFSGKTVEDCKLVQDWLGSILGEDLSAEMKRLAKESKGENDLEVHT